MKARLSLDPRNLLGLPALYAAFQHALGQGRSKRRLVKDIIRVRPGERVLDIGCGPARILEYMPEGVAYCGFDLDPDYIAAARKDFGHRGSFEVRAVSADSADDLGSFDVVMAIGVLHHLTDDEADGLFLAASRVLKPGARIVTVDGAFITGQHPLARQLLKLDRGRFVRTPEAYVQLAQRHFPQAATRILHDLLAIPYTHCVIEAKQVI